MSSAYQDAAESSMLNAAKEGAIFRMMLMTAQNDPAEFRIVVEILVHRLHWSLAAAEESIQTELNSFDADASLASRLSTGCCVWVLSPDLVNLSVVGSKQISKQHPVDMQCPPLSLIYWHSAVLGNVISELQVHWDNIGLKSTQLVNNQSSISDYDIRLLPGEYDVWQEVHSVYK